MNNPGEVADKRYQWCRMLLTREIARLEKNTATLNDSSSDRRNALWLKQIGDSIAASADTIRRGSKEISVVNIHTGLHETVPLNPKCSPQKNAALYHKKALKAQRVESAENREQNTTLSILNDLRDALRNLTLAMAGKEPRSVEEAIEKGIAVLELVTPGITGRDPKNDSSIPYRHISYEGWNIYIGKTDEQNDELSLKFARSSDIWLHVAGHAGSHVVIRRPKGAPAPPETVIEAAAALSVWYSKVRNAPFAEVHLTAARNVRKRQGAPPGEVIVEQWKSLKVAPQPPEAFTGTGS